MKPAEIEPRLLNCRARYFEALVQASSGSAEGQKLGRKISGGREGLVSNAPDPRPPNILGSISL